MFISEYWGFDDTALQEYVIINGAGEFLTQCLLLCD